LAYQEIYNLLLCLHILSAIGATYLLVNLDLFVHVMHWWRWDKT